MKKRLLATLMTAVMAATALAGCGGSSNQAGSASGGTSAAASADSAGGDSQAGASAEGGKDYKIAVVVKGNTNGWFIRMNEGIEKWAGETGINAWMTGPTDTDSAQQIQIIQDIINQDIDITNMT